MPDTNIDAPTAYHLPRHLAQTLISQPLQHDAPGFGLLYRTAAQQDIRAGDCQHDIPALLADIRQHLALGHQPVGLYQFGRRHETPRPASIIQAQTCAPEITLLLELSADTRGRIDLNAFTCQHGELRLLEVQLEEDGVLYPDCVNR